MMEETTHSDIKLKLFAVEIGETLHQAEIGFGSLKYV
jgi:hypothetical protein